MTGPSPEATGQEGRCLACGGTGETFYGSNQVRCDDCRGTGVTSPTPQDGEGLHPDVQAAASGDPGVVGAQVPAESREPADPAGDGEPEPPS